LLSVSESEQVTIRIFRGLMRSSGGCNPRFDGHLLTVIREVRRENDPPVGQEKGFYLNFFPDVPDPE
ncbi:hypothetical protein AVEN_254644-1, partial [Araneus ventricosus]